MQSKAATVDDYLKKSSGEAVEGIKADEKTILEGTQRLQGKHAVWRSLL